MSPRSKSVRLSLATRLLGSATALAVALAAPGPAVASVDGEMQSFMSDMGAQANATGPVAYQGQAAGYYSLGNVWSRFPQKNVQPFNLQLPHSHEFIEHRKPKRKREAVGIQQGSKGLQRH